MTELIITVSVTAALTVAVACSLFGRGREPKLDEDINNPTIATIDLALAHMDRDSDPDAVDWLLDRRLAAKRGEVA